MSIVTKDPKNSSIHLKTTLSSSTLVLGLRKISSSGTIVSSLMKWASQEWGRFIHPRFRSRCRSLLRHDAHSVRWSVWAIKILGAHTIKHRRKQKSGSCSLITQTSIKFRQHWRRQCILKIVYRSCEIFGMFRTKSLASCNYGHRQVSFTIPSRINCVAIRRRKRFRGERLENSAGKIIFYRSRI